MGAASSKEKCKTVFVFNLFAIDCVTKSIILKTMLNSQEFWNGKNVFVTGHTGFKGGWLSLWLSELGVNLHGYSLSPTDQNDFYNRVFDSSYPGSETFADIRDIEKLRNRVISINPDIIFHLAAEPLVRRSFSYPLETFQVNVMGTVNLLESIRTSGTKPIIINVTTDKVYENNECFRGYRESDKLGGKDPYSASKSCSEFVTNSYREAYFERSRIRISSARAGNVIGGGDMASDRLIPDFFRSLKLNAEVVVRNPLSIRPWQHVLEPISGYLILAERMAQQDGKDYVGSWNFGPSGDPRSVEDVIKKLMSLAGSKNLVIDKNSGPSETNCLMLDSARARRMLDWESRLSVEQALEWTYEWFTKSQQGANMADFSLKQIYGFSELG